MHITELIFLSFALGIDCLVVSFSQGLIFTKNKTKNSLALAFTVGLAQSIMPLIGYIGIGFLSKYIETYSKWLVFAIFLALGLKFIYESFQEKEKTVCCIGLKCLIGLGIATSIDAMAAGISLRLTNAHLLISITMIGLASFFMSICGFWLGNSFKKLPSKYLEIFGGIILIILAIKAVLV